MTRWIQSGKKFGCTWKIQTLVSNNEGISIFSSSQSISLLQYHSSNDHYNTNDSATYIRFCDVMLSPSCCQNGQYSLTILPKESKYPAGGKDTKSSVIGSNSNNNVEKYVISSLLVKPPRSSCSSTSSSNNNNNNNNNKSKARRSKTTTSRSCSSSTLLKSRKSTDTLSTLSQNYSDAATTTATAAPEAPVTLRQGILVGKTSILRFNKKHKRPFLNQIRRRAGKSKTREDPSLNINSSSTDGKYSCTKHIHGADSLRSRQS